MLNKSADGGKVGGLYALSKFIGGALASGEVNAYATQDRPNFLEVDKDGNRNYMPALASGLADPNARMRYIFAGGLGGWFTKRWGGKGLAMSGLESFGVGTLSSATNYFKAQTDALENGKQNKQKPVTVKVDNAAKKETTSDKVFNYGSVLLGLAGLGLGGYALYKSLTGNKAKAKVKLRGKADDPYDDVEVEMPMDQLNISNTMGKRVNTSVRKTIHDSNKFNSRKKDKETGKLISYEEYIGKYGEDDKTKENVLQPLEKQSSYIPDQLIYEKDLERARKKHEKDLERARKKYEKDLKYKGIGMGIGSVLGGIGGYMFGSQAFNGPYPTSYSPGIVNTVGGIGGVLGGGLLGGYLADKFSGN